MARTNIFYFVLISTIMIFIISSDLKSRVKTYNLCEETFVQEINKFIPNIVTIEYTGNLNTSNRNECFPKVVSTNRTILDLKEQTDNCNIPYITILDTGRTGNQICQYISLLIIEKLFNVKVAVSEKMYKTINKLFESSYLPKLSSGCYKKIEKYYKFSAVFQILNENNEFYSEYPIEYATYINHNACPHELIVEHRDYIKSKLKFKSNLLSKARKYLELSVRKINRTLNSKINLVTVHVRRTDYIEYFKIRLERFLPNFVYYKKALNYYRNHLENPVFVIISDDIKWCKSNIKGKDVVYFKGGSIAHPEADLAALSLGHHHIISHGTFGFTGSILGNGSIIYPFEINSNNQNVALPIQQTGLSCVNTSDIISIGITYKFY